MTAASPSSGHPGRIQARTIVQDDKSVSIIPPQELAYYEGQSPDFTLDLVPDSARRVLDVGCGRGWLGKRLKERGVEEVVGIESFGPAAAEAETVLDVVYTGDVEAVQFEYPAGYFDCIVYSGVLEHMRDPWFTLYDHRRILADDGSVVALLPNVQHYSVFLDLLQGRWEYQSAGQLDATHYRFFTRAEIQRMFQETGFQMGPLRGHKFWDTPPQVQQLARTLESTGLTTPEFIHDLEMYIWTLRADKIASWTPSERRAQPVRIAGVGTLGAAAAETPSAQEATPAAAAAAPAPAVQTSIVVVTYNSMADLPQCLDSIAKHSRTQYEVIVIDNASTDGTGAWVQQRSDVTAILNGHNRGFSVATNQGLQIARGEYCILLNPDTVVTEGWDTRLIAAAAQPGVGASGPVANGSSSCGWQRLEMWLKEELEGQQQVQSIARKMADWYPSQTRETKLLTGFCLCIPRRVLDQVGLLDEDLFMGCDDVDFSLRLQWAGYRLVVALDAFILHKGMGSFRDVPDDVRARYIQESVDVLYAKLEEHYGKGLVPTWPELIELPWHLPTHLQGDVFTGERANPHSMNMLPDVMIEHWARYTYAQPHAAGKHVLDAACGTGYGSAHLAEVAASVTGWDVDAETAAYAKSKAPHDNLWFGVGDVRKLPVADQSFDMITSFETIEHVAEGRQVLAEFQRVLRPDGVLFISTPLGSYDGNPYHFAHYNRADFGPMLEDFFDEVEMLYQKKDQFSDQTDLPMVLDKFRDEYALAVCRKPKPVDGKPAATFSDSGLSQEVPMIIPTNGATSTNGAAPARASTPAETDAAPIISVIIPAWNELAYTQHCVHSVRERTPEHCEIIVVDNGSNDGTAEWLAGQADVRTISNPENRGFAIACNQGMAAARGRYLVLLNNDTIVTPGWTTGLIAAIERHPDVGLVGPLANRVGGWQMDPTATYTDEEGLVAHAAACAADRSGVAEDVPMLSGFCWMLTRETYDTVGSFDERFGLGTFEDNDYCKRIALAGLRMLIAHDVFIHHQCSATFTAAGIDYTEQMNTNRPLLREKWADDATFAGIDAFEAGDFDAALAHFNAAIAANDRYADPYGNLALTYGRLRRWSETAHTLEGLCELRPLQWRAHLQLANVYRRLDRPVDAGQKVEFLLNQRYLPPGLREAVLVLAGELAICAQDWDTAGHAFRTALTTNTKVAGAWNGLGLIAHQAGQADEARESFRRASELDAQAADPHSNLGVLAWQAGRVQEALTEFTAALDRDPLHADALDNFVAAALADGQAGMARERVQAALAVDPAWGPGQELLALCETD